MSSHSSTASTVSQAATAASRPVPVHTRSWRHPARDRTHNRLLRRLDDRLLRRRCTCASGKPLADTCTLHREVRRGSAAGAGGAGGGTVAVPLPAPRRTGPPAGLDPRWRPDADPRELMCGLVPLDDVQPVADEEDGAPGMPGTVAPRDLTHGYLASPAADEPVALWDDSGRRQSYVGVDARESSHGSDGGSTVGGGPDV